MQKKYKICILSLIIGIISIISLRNYIDANQHATGRCRKCGGLCSDYAGSDAEYKCGEKFLILLENYDFDKIENSN